MTSKEGDINNEFIAVGDLRVFNDSDKLASKITTWPATTKSVEPKANGRNWSIFTKKKGN